MYFFNWFLSIMTLVYLKRSPHKFSRFWWYSIRIMIFFSNSIAGHISIAKPRFCCSTIILIVYSIFLRVKISIRAMEAITKFVSFVNKSQILAHVIQTDHASLIKETWWDKLTDRPYRGENYLFLLKKVNVTTIVVTILILNATDWHLIVEIVVFIQKPTFEPLSFWQLVTAKIKRWSRECEFSFFFLFFLSAERFLKAYTLQI